MPTSNQHIPVLLSEVVNFLDEPKGVTNLKIFDGTLGGGGYTREFLAHDWQVFACDLDQAAIDRVKADWHSSHIQRASTSSYPGSREVNEAVGKTKLTNEPLQLTLSRDNFAHHINTFPDSFFDGIVLDLGFSSNQLTSGERGFSHQNLGERLDLRYDPSQGVPAWQKLTTIKTSVELKKILFIYSGETLSPRLAQAIFDLVQKQVADEPLTVGQLVDCLEAAIPAKFQVKKRAILSRVWQALRIWTNDELTTLEKFLQTAPGKLKPKGKLVIVSFHSLEDKIVTRTMRNLAQPINIDDFGNKIQKYKLPTPKAITPKTEEIEQNPRSRSSLLRVLEKVI